jgi:hypothetical protein
MAFLREASSFFGATDVSSGDASLERLLRALREGGPYLLVLGRPESVQDTSAGRGCSRAASCRIPSCATCFARIANGLGTTRALITSRFPLTDLTSWAGESRVHTVARHARTAVGHRGAPPVGVLGGR